MTPDEIESDGSVIIEAGSKINSSVIFLPFKSFSQNLRYVTN